MTAAQKPSYGTAAYSRLVNRPLARRVAAAAHVVGLTPNQATAVSATLSGAGIGCLAVLRPGLGMALAVAFLLAFGYVMDSVDGQLSRLRGGGTVSGEWLDHTIDCFKTSMLHLAVAVSWFRFPVVESPWVLLIPLAFEVVAVSTYFGLILMPSLRKAAAPVAPAAENPWRTWLLLPVDYGTLCLVFVLVAWPPAFLAAYSLMLVASGGALALALGKWWAELRAIDAESASPAL